MSLVPQVTAIRPRKSQRNILTVGFNLKLTDDNVEVINIDCTDTIPIGGDIDNALAEAEKKAQEHINNYLDESDRNDQEYTDKVAAIELNVVRAIK